MLGDGLQSLIPPRKNDSLASRAGGEEEIEFPLPDITNGGKGTPTSAGDILVAPTPRLMTVAHESEADGRQIGPARVFQIETDKIKPNPHQPRRDFNEGALRELAESIREFGILQPLVVSKVEKEVETGSAVEYELIAGERRLMAAKMLGLPTVPVIIRQTSADAEKLELAVTENIQREDLNPIESARAISKLQDKFGMTQREIAVRLGKSRESISNTVRLLSLPSVMQTAISEGKISESQGRLLLSVDDPKIREVLFREAVNQRLSVRDLETRIRRISGQRHEARSGVKKILDPETLALKEQLEELLGTRVDMKNDGKSGKIIINFYSQEEFDALVEKLLRQNDNQPTAPPSSL
ncbi:MAG: ParB/RepB/Spo0J family partition protein [Candidatus Colwellbacteria bacterium]|nr:ParB/RepB/Spo0J family partition protein [Candidatus Colwellbacteria bacterium]